MGDARRNGVGLAGRLRRNGVLRFNYHNRDKWVAAQAAAIPAGSRVLDVGAGTCPYRGLFAHCEYRAQDFKQLEPEKNRYGEAYGHIDYVCDVTDIPVAPESFDAVLCTEVLEHVPDPEAVVSECARVLRPGGTLLLTAPLGSGLHQEPYHYFGGFTPYWYRHVLPKHGLVIDELSGNGDTFQHYGQFGQYVLMRLAPWKLGPLRGLVAAPLWLALAPVLGVGVPALAHLAKGLARDEKFTVGYHVRATKARA